MAAASNTIDAWLLYQSLVPASFRLGGFAAFGNSAACLLRLEGGARHRLGPGPTDGGKFEDEAEE